MGSLKSAYKILPNENLVLEFHRGTLEASAYIEFKKILLEDPLFKPNLNHFINFKNVIFETPPEELKTFVGYIKNNVQALGKRKLAFVTDTPNQVVTTTMYQIMLQNSTLISEIFSTNETALHWLNPPTLTTDKLMTILSELDSSI